MNSRDRVAVCSRSFSRNLVLRDELQSGYRKVTFNDTGQSLSGTDLAAYLEGHDKAIIGLEQIDETVLDAVPELRVISKYGVGTDMLDLEAMARRGVRLGWTAGVNSRAVAELVIALTIALLRDLPDLSRGIERGEWRQAIGRQLSGRTVGIVGWGSIGRDLADLLAPFGCRVLATDVRDVDTECRLTGVESLALEALLSEADVVTLHVPLTEGTEGLIGEAQLGLLRPDSVLVNASRGGVVDEYALHDALVSGRLRGAAMDVFRSEPPFGSPLLGLPNFVATPHIGGSTEEAYLAMGRAAIRGLDDNVVPDC
jgi:D-3-phosphoglycerate dehydrogenase